MILQGNQLLQYLSDKVLSMVFRNAFPLMLFSVASGCSYNIAAQKTFDFSATYYMDGTCEIELPNRNRVFVSSGIYYSRFQKRDKRIRPSYMLVCESDINSNAIRSPSLTTSLTTAFWEKNYGPSILLSDENHVELTHRLPPESWRDDDYRFIQFENDLLLDTRIGAESSQLGLDNYFQPEENRRRNYNQVFSFRFAWTYLYARQLPGFTNQPCTPRFSATEISFLIHGRKKAEETGVYARMTGENGSIANGSCK